MRLPVADHWFERRTVAPDLTLLTEPHVDRFVRCNIWHARGRDRDLLIDTGLGIASLTSAASDLFETSFGRDRLIEIVDAYLAWRDA